MNRLNLQSWLPKDLHTSINKTLVGFGQVICLPVGPRCDLCDVAKVPGLCPSKQAVSPRKTTRAKAEQAEVKAEPKVEVVAPAIIDGQIVEGKLLEAPDGSVQEIRSVKVEEAVIEGALSW